MADSLLQEDGFYILQEDGTSKILLDNAQLYTQSLTGTLSFSGSLAKRIAYPLTGTLSFIGLVVRVSRRALTGTLSFIGTHTRLRTAYAAFVARLSFSQPVWYANTTSANVSGNTGWDFT